MADAMLSEHNKPESEDSRAKSKASKSKQTERKHDKDASKKKANDKVSSPPKTRHLSSRTPVPVEAEVHVVEPEPAGSKKQDVTLSDVMSFLKDIKTNQDKTDKKLKELTVKVNEMYEVEEDYDENQLLYGDDDNIELNDDQTTSNVNENGQNDDNNNEEPPAKRKRTDEGQSNDTSNKTGDVSNSGTKKSKFKELVETQKYKKKEKLDVPVDSDLAELVNNLFLNGLPDHQLSELVKSIDRPENCDMLTKTKVNHLIWDLLSDSTRDKEIRAQYRQGLLVKAAILITKLVNKLNDCSNITEISELPIQDLMNMGTDALGILGHCSRAMNLSRRELHRPDLSSEYYHLGSSTAPFTQFLYGDDIDISKKVSDIDSVNKVGRKVMRGRGSGRAFRRGGGRWWSRRGRGRGYVRPSYREHDNPRDSNPGNSNVGGASRYDSKNLKRGFRRTGTRY